MKRIVITFLPGVFMLLFLFSARIKASIPWLPVDGISYYMMVDTGTAHIGYLSLGGTDLKQLVVSGEQDVYALWQFKNPLNEPDVFYIVNKRTSDTLFFREPGGAADISATIDRTGTLSLWYDLFLERDRPSLMKLKSSTAEFYLTLDAADRVNLSPPGSSAARLRFEIVRAKYLPDEQGDYRFRVDTTGIPGVDWLGYLSADTIVRPDSLTVDIGKDNPSRGDLSLWSFSLDTIITDTAYFKIRNRATDSLLAFDAPAADTLACVRNSGRLDLWRIPFFTEEDGGGYLALRDTAGLVDYYLGLRGDRVMLLTDTTNYPCLKFVLERDEIPYVPDSCIVGGDSIRVHKVKYLNGVDSGKYLGVDLYGRKALLDTVYAHLPEGQFVVYKQNKYTLMSRTGSVTTGRYTGGAFDESDSLKVVCNASGDTLPGLYTNTVDTFEIVPVGYGNMEAEKLKPFLGYRYFRPDELSSDSYVFSYTSADTLNGRVIGYDAADSLVMLLAAGDTARFVADVSGFCAVGAPAIAGIPKLERYSYRFRSTEDSTLYFSIRADSLALDTLPHQSSFFLKEDTMPGRGYYFIEDNGPSGVAARKLLTDSTRYFNLARIDSTDTHVFAIIRKDRYIAEADPYDYLTELPHGRGLYEFSATIADVGRYLTKNYFHYAVFGKEGESMLRSGSFAPADFHLWVDTARGPGHNPEKPSFYLIREVDTLASQASRMDVSGWFLHVMDSAFLPLHDDYVVEADGRTYNRVNFVKAKRRSANELLLESPDPQAKDSVGFAGKNEYAIREYRFYLQVAAPDVYYIVTEQGYGGKSGIRGYLSYKKGDRTQLYVGPRVETPDDDSEGQMIPLTISKANMVSNEAVPPPVGKVRHEIAVIGGSGQVTVLHAAGMRVTIYNVVGQQVADRVIASDKETIPVSRGILIVKAGEKTTRKVIVR